MAHFYSTANNGVHQTKTMRGFKNQGMDFNMASWNGAISVRIYTDSDGVDRFRVSQTTWCGNGVSEELASGIIGEQIN